jgi:hypothetical protein
MAETRAAGASEVPIEAVVVFNRRDVAT